MKVVPARGGPAFHVDLDELIVNATNDAGDDYSVALCKVVHALVELQAPQVKHQILQPLYEANQVVAAP